MNSRQTVLSRVDYPWSYTEDKELVDRFVAGVSAASIAAEFGRTEGAIRCRVSLLGLAQLPELHINSPRFAVLVASCQLEQPVTVNDLVESVIRRLPYPDNGKRDTRRRQVRVAYEKLLADGVLICRDGYVTRRREARSSR